MDKEKNHNGLQAILDRYQKEIEFLNHINRSTPPKKEDIEYADALQVKVYGVFNLIDRFCENAEIIRLYDYEEIMRTLREDGRDEFPEKLHEWISTINVDLYNLSETIKHLQESFKLIELKLKVEMPSYLEKKDG